VVLCSVIAYVWLSIFAANVAILVSFGTGFFSVQFILKQIRKMAITKFGDKIQVEFSSDLSKLQGLSSQTIDRLEEEDILNCQTLAYCDPIKILYKTHYQMKVILDWVDQALLYIYVGDKIKDLHKSGIRGITEFAILYESEHKAKVIDSLRRILDSTPELVENFLDVTYNDPHIRFIWNLFSESSGDDSV
jgi:hypothetical protein